MITVHSDEAGPLPDDRQAAGEGDNASTTVSHMEPSGHRRYSRPYGSQHPVLYVTRSVRKTDPEMPMTQLADLGLRIHLIIDFPFIEEDEIITGTMVLHERNGWDHRFRCVRLPGREDMVETLGFDKMNSSFPYFRSNRSLGATS